MTETVTDNRDRSRFELDIDGQIVFANYKRRGAEIAINHVEAPIPLRGTGAAGRLMIGIMDIARGEGSKIVPYCGYAITWMRRHQAQYGDLLA